VAEEDLEVVVEEETEKEAEEIEEVEEEEGEVVEEEQVEEEDQTTRRRMTPPLGSPSPNLEDSSKKNVSKNSRRSTFSPFQSKNIKSLINF
jgi:hypothetical protein